MARLDRWTRKAAIKAAKKWPWAVAGVTIAVGGIAGSSWLASVQLPQIGPAAQSSKLFTYDGQVIATLHGEENRTIVPLDQISPYLRIAVLSTEDKTFFDHRGFSLKGVIRAARANMEGGEIVQGGSTITQQYVRNTFPDVGTDKTIARKLKELFWAVQLERHYDKEEIMERYLNTVYFGRGAYGAEAAARTYFKVPASDLTVGQSAYLAGLIKAPQRFQINEKPEEAIELRNIVIRKMVREGFLGPGEGKTAGEEDLVAQFKPGMTIEVDSPRAGYFVEYVRRILRSEFHLSNEEILSGGLQIHTTLDLKMQDAAEAAIKKVLNRPEDPDAAIVAMDSEGRVKAMVGGRDVDSIDRARGFNFAVDVNASGGGRPAGSAFKPFALAGFLSEGKSLQSSFSGASPIKINSPKCHSADGKPWEVSNFGLSSYGHMDVTGATLSSVNTIYAQIMDQVVTPEKFIEIAGKTGIQIPSFDTGCALTLGTTDVTPMEMARAYTTFAQRGKRPEPLVITKITRPNGEVVAERTPKLEQQVDQNVADTVNYVLEKNIQSGTGTGARISRPAAGKTGTTQNFQDAWFAGYTPELTAVVWMGYAPTPEGKIPEMTKVQGRQVTGGSFPATIWKNFMAKALDGVKPSGFHKPKLGGDILHRAPPPSAVLASADSSWSDEPASGATGSDDESDESDEEEEPTPPRRSSRSRESEDITEFPSCFPFC
jgi:penicillin-binding protein 1A